MLNKHILVPKKLYSIVFPFSIVFECHSFIQGYNTQSDVCSTSILKNNLSHKHYTTLQRKEMTRNHFQFPVNLAHVDREEREGGFTQKKFHTNMKCEHTLFSFPCFHLFFLPLSPSTLANLFCIQARISC